ncbi:MAG: sigma-70 family RNA polymerase sigma factor [Alphaproteobacteria bacterium]|nr:sigma-70 family RNA polymerase sigma factor [Alphaproteobacteria bacterium]
MNGLGAAVRDDGLIPLQVEQAVVVRLHEGDRQAAGQLYVWYGERLFRQVILPRLPIRELAEDVLRDTFRLALERIDQFRLTDRSIFYWLRRIAINRAIDVHRAHQREQRLQDKVEQEADRVMGQAPPAPDRGQQVAETRALVEEALEQLNPRYAEALRLRLIEDRDREECADLMGVTVGNFDVILHRATKAFRKKYPPR